MKKVKTYSLVVFAALSLFTSCSKDDDSVDSSPNNDGQVAFTIDGTWKLTSFNTTTPLDLNGDGVAEANIIAEANCYTNETIVFNADSTGVTKVTSYANIDAVLEIGTTDSYTYSSECIDEIEDTNFTWSKNSDTVTIVNEDLSTYSLSLNSDNELIVTFEDAFSVEDPDSGVTVVSDEDFTMIYTKQ